jgi:hypothetical protein
MIDSSPDDLNSKGDANQSHKKAIPRFPKM